MSIRIPKFELELLLRGLSEAPTIPEGKRYAATNGTFTMTLDSDGWAELTEEDSVGE